MTTLFKLDTSGQVTIIDDPQKQYAFREYLWSDLDPFTQGYIEAMFEWEAATGDNFGGVSVDFSDLAQETLAAILKDCAAFLALYPPSEEYSRSPHDVNDGAYMWKDRQNGLYPEGFPPLIRYLGDDGKVRLK